MHHPRRVLRRSGAVLAGIVLSVGTDVVLHATGGFPPLGQPMVDALILLAAAYRTAYGGVGAPDSGC